MTALSPLVTPLREAYSQERVVKIPALGAYARERIGDREPEPNPRPVYSEASFMLVSGVTPKKRWTGSHPWVSVPEKGWEIENLSPICLLQRKCGEDGSLLSTL